MSVLVQSFVLTVPAAGQISQGVFPADFFILKSAGAPLDVAFLDANGSEVGRAEQVIKGANGGVNQFVQVTFYNTTAAAVEVEFFACVKQWSAGVFGDVTATLTAASAPTVARVAGAGDLSAVVFAADAEAREVILSNKGTATVYLNIGAAADANDFPLEPDEKAVLSTNAAIHAISVGAALDVRVLVMK